MANSTDAHGGHSAADETSQTRKIADHRIQQGPKPARANVTSLGPPDLSAAARRQLLQIAQHSVETVIARRTVPDPETLPDELQQKAGAFVTIYHRGQLRGCLGRLEAREPLGRLVAHLAASAVTEDPRFSDHRLAPRDIPEVTVEVTVLSPLARVAAKDVEVGVHGIQVKRKGKSGCFLPQVASERGWTSEQFLSVCCADKAGLAADAWKDPAVEISVFTATKIGP